MTMAYQDPWMNREINARDTHPINLSKLSDCFEDNFKPEVYERLPDSAEYLALLESKLNKIKNDPNVLKQLADKREACLNQLLSSSDYYCETISLEAPINNSAILRTLAPEKIALNQGEIVELVKYDQLQESSSDSETTPKENTKNDNTA